MLNGGIKVALVGGHPAGLAVALEFGIGPLRERAEFRGGRAILAFGIVRVFRENTHRAQRHNFVAAEDTDVFAGDGPLEPVREIGAGLGRGERRHIDAIRTIPRRRSSEVQSHAIIGKP